MTIKKSTSFDSLVNIIKVLGKSEIDILRKYLKGFLSNHTIGKNKLGLIFKEIVANPEINFKELKRKTAPNLPESSYNRLLYRLIDKIQESLIIDININRKESYSKLFKLRFQIKKQLISLEILKSRTLNSIVLKKLNKIILTSIKMEFFQEVVLALYLKRDLLLLSGLTNEIDQINSELIKYEGLNLILKESDFIYKSYFSRRIKKVENKVELKDLNSCLKKLLINYNKTKSSNIQSLFLLLKQEQQSILRNSYGEIELGNELLSLLEREASVFSESRIAYINFNLAFAEIQRINFLAAINFSKRAIELLSKKKGLNILIALEFKAKAELLEGNLEAFHQTYTENINNISFDNYIIQKNKMTFLYSVYLFFVKDYKLSLVNFDGLLEFEKDKSGWNYWIRLFRILCNIELNRFDLCEYEIDSFRKYCYRLNRTNLLNKRQMLILEILIRVLKSNYDFQIVYSESRKEIDNLRKVNSSFGWLVSSPEIIIFHRWFLNKLNKKQYSFCLKKYRDAVIGDLEKFEIYKV